MVLLLITYFDNIPYKLNYKNSHTRPHASKPFPPPPPTSPSPNLSYYKLNIVNHLDSPCLYPTTKSKGTKNALPTPPPIRPGKTHRNPHPRRTKSLLRQRTNLLILSQLHRHPRRLSHRPPQFRRHCRPHISRTIHAGGHGYDGVCADHISLAGEEY